MRSLYREGDVVGGEVQQVNPDGTIQLHARSARYGKLENGILCVVPPCLVKRSKVRLCVLDEYCSVPFANELKPSLIC